MKEVLRKLGLVANWLCLGSPGIILTFLGLFVEDKQEDQAIFLIFGIALFVMALVAHKVINWVFD